MRICIVCEKEFEESYHNQTICSDKCVGIRKKNTIRTIEKLKQQNKGQIDNRFDILDL